MVVVVERNNHETEVLSGKKRLTIRRLAAVALALGMVILYIRDWPYAEDSTDVTAECGFGNRGGRYLFLPGTMPVGFQREKTGGFASKQRGVHQRARPKERIKKENLSPEE